MSHALPQSHAFNQLQYPSASSLISTSQVCQLNYCPQTVSSSFHCSPLQMVQSNPEKSHPAVVSNKPFEVKFLTPSIKICAGCRQGYARAADGKTCLPAPYDLCLVHKEQHLCYNVVNGKQQLSSLSNVHYHANVTCARARFPDFNPQCVQVPQEIKLRLQPAHWIFLLQTFGIV